MKNITIIAGLSASGKSTILAEMVSNYNYTQLITTTTRDPRPNEINGISYHFISKEEFVERRNNGEFLESVEAKGNFYGLRLNEFDKDFGNKKPIKIYQNADELLNLNTNHLLLFQGDKTIQELFAFCENNQSANKRLLFIDKDHASTKSKELLKLMIPDEEI